MIFLKIFCLSYQYLIYVDLYELYARIICKSSFNDLCLKNEKHKSQFVVACFIIKSWRYTVLGSQSYLNEYLGWNFLDIDSKQWYTMKVDEVPQKT